MTKLIAQGAEAKIYLDKNIILKSRIKKSYRHQILDQQIRTRRTKKEAKILEKALKSNINVPKVIKSDKFNLEIEFIDGEKLSETLNSYRKEKQSEVIQRLGEQTAKLHENNIIHGDLTTSNVILPKQSSNQSENLKPYIIDFGLGFISPKIEDKAVDLHLIKQALEAKHWENYEELFQDFLLGYKHKDSKKVIERLGVVERRGRYKH